MSSAPIFMNPAPRFMKVGRELVKVVSGFMSFMLKLNRFRSSFINPAAKCTSPWPRFMSLGPRFIGPQVKGMRVLAGLIRLAVGFTRLDGFLMSLAAKGMRSGGGLMSFRARLVKGGAGLMGVGAGG